MPNGELRPETLAKWFGQTPNAPQEWRWMRQHAYDHGWTLRDYERNINRRLIGEPLAYILGEWDFFGLTLAISRDVLIPRPETETLVDRVLRLLDEAPKRVIDVGTGSGAIALALKSHRPGWAVTASDISPQALALARENAATHGLDIDFIEADGVPPGDWDVLIANPPYVDWRDSGLDPSVSKWEPGLALFSPDGTRHATEWLNQAADLGVRDLFMELGLDQPPKLAETARERGASQTEILEDLTGRPRYLWASWRS